MRLNKNLRDVILVITVIIIPLLILGLINGWFHILKIKECHSSTGNLIACHLEKVCVKRDLYNNCFEDLKQSVSEITARALQSNNSTICREVEEKLQFTCYYEFARKLEFTLDEVFINGLKGRDLELCNSLSGQLRKKCFFNLALQEQDTNLCSETEELSQRCNESIGLIWNEISREDLFLITKARMRFAKSKPGSDAQKMNIKLKNLLDTEDYLTGEEGWLKFFNDEDSNLDGTKFILFKNMRLVDIDGCRHNPLLYSGNTIMESWDDERDPRLCYLDFSTEAKNLVLEITYNGETVFVDAGCTSDSCREEFRKIR